MHSELEGRLAKIIKPETGRTVMLAVDHGYFQGPTSGLENPGQTIKPLLSYCDALSPAKGVLIHCVHPEAETAIILRASGGNSMVYNDPVELEREFKIRSQGVKTTKELKALRDRVAGEIMNRELSNEGVTVSIGEAKRLKVDGVSVSIYVGSRYQRQTILNLSKMSDDAKREGLVVLGITAVGKEMARDARYLGLASRIVAEHGADIVKTYYCKDFEQVVNGCFVPIVIAGGKKVAEKAALEFSYQAIQSGAAGVDMGRNIFQSDHPVAMIRAVRSVVHENFKAKEAYQLFLELKSSKPIAV